MSRVARNLKVRVFHALGFEAGFVLIGVPIAAWMLSISFVQAFMLEIGFFLFFLPYTMFYNWAYDTLREKVIKRRQQRRALAN
ncbi:Bacterial Transmembrane Pair family protein [compost metagenome]